MEILLSVILTVLAILATWYFASKYGRSAGTIVVTWNDLWKFAELVAQDAMASEFKPDIIMGSAGPSTIAAVLVGMKIDEEIPVYVMQQKGARDEHGNPTKDPFPTKGTEAVTDKWRTLIPRECLTDPSRSVLIVHDAILSGRVVHAVMGIFTAKKFGRKAVRTAALLQVEGAECMVKPDYTGKSLSAAKVKMPWGDISRTRRIAQQTDRRAQFIT